MVNLNTLRLTSVIYGAPTTWRLRVVIHIVDAVGYTISRRREATRNVTPLRHRKRTPSFRTNVVVESPCNQNENNHPAFAGGFKRSRGSGHTISRRREAT
jgi:hypothetical protein